MKKYMHKNKNVRQLHIRGHVTGARSSATPDSKRQMNAEHILIFLCQLECEFW